MSRGHWGGGKGSGVRGFIPVKYREGWHRIFSNSSEKQNSSNKSEKPINLEKQQ